MTRKLFTPEGLVFDSIEEATRARFDQSVEAERARHAMKGYTPEHDAEHGIDHLIAWAYEYTWRGDRVKAAAMLVALRDLIGPSPIRTDKAIPPIQVVPGLVKNTHRKEVTR